MNLLGILLAGALLLTLGCGGGPSTTAAPTSSNTDFQRLCRAVGAEGGRISRDQFLAQSADKDTAARLFDACDVNRDAVVVESEIPPERMESLQRQVIRLTTPRR
jgi:hypothetical protein